MEMSVPLNALASTAYLGVATMCCVALRHAQRAQRGLPERVRWAVLATFFAALAPWRFFGVEEMLRTGLRQHLLQYGEYGERREFQAPLAALAIVVIAVVIAGLLFLHRARSRTQQRASRTAAAMRLADMSAAVMLGLVVMRVISFHWVDALLYRGPHLNWIVDIGTSALVAIGAWQYVRVVASRKG